MDLQVFDRYSAMCQAISDEICAQLRKNPEMLLCIAAGHTSLGLFDALRAAYEGGTADFSRASFVAMDEWLNMSDRTPDSCGDFLRKNFLQYVNFAPERTRLFDGQTGSHRQECQAVEDFIQEHSHTGHIDYLVLGSGMNGHLALNEPGTSFDARAHVSVLDPVTQNVGQKYFSEQAALTGGITLGIANFREAERTVLMVNGSHKSTILERIVNAPISESIPATALRSFRNASLYCDRDAAALLK